MGEVALAVHVEDLEVVAATAGAAMAVAMEAPEEEGIEAVSEGVALEDTLLTDRQKRFFVSPLLKKGGGRQVDLCGHMMLLPSWRDSCISTTKPRTG